MAKPSTIDIRNTVTKELLEATGYVGRLTTDITELEILKDGYSVSGKYTVRKWLSSEIMEIGTYNVKFDPNLQLVSLKRTPT